MIKYIPTLTFSAYLIAMYYAANNCRKSLTRGGMPWYTHLFYVIPTIIVTVAICCVFYVEYLKYFGDVQ